MKFALDAQVEALLRVVEGSDDEALRLWAIRRIADLGTPDAARVLVEVWERCAWRETRVALLHALGRMGQERGTELLIRAVGDPGDVALGAEAVVALGGCNRVAVGELLASVVEGGEPAHRREAIMALSRQSWPSAALMARTLEQAAGEGATGLVQYLVLALGVVGTPERWPLVERWLDPAAPGPVFNAALLSAGRLADGGGVRRLQGLDLRARFFAEQLRDAAVAHARVRARVSVEDAVEGVRGAGPHALRDALQVLAAFPRGEAREAFSVLAEGAPAALSCVVRAALAGPDTVAEDVTFLVDAAHGGGDPEAAATLAIALREVDAAALPAIHAGLPAEASRALMARVREPAAVERLAAVVERGEDSAARIEAINALVSQARMVVPRAEHAARVGEEVLRLTRQVTTPEVRSRLLRALGQLRVGGAAGELERRMQAGDAAFGSAVFGLSHLGAAGAPALLRRLATRRGHGETAHLLAGLARVGELPSTEALSGVVPLGRERLAMLQILSRNQVAGQEALLHACLQGDFTERLLAIAACRHNYTERLREPLLAAFRGDIPALAQRALDSLCASGDAAVARELLDWALRPGATAPEALKVLRSLRAGELLERLDEALRDRPPVLEDPDVLAAAIRLRDLLAPSPEAPAGDAHTADADLEARLPGYGRYSEAAKSVLRNAELTVGRTDLFDDRVDKSTILVEYVKSIDLVLQETVGAAVFAEASPHLTAMRARVVQLGLDEEALAAPELIALLDCAGDFTPEALPVQKVVALCRAVRTGRIEKSPYRIIDGLRAWAMVLLVFGRQLRSGGVALEPVLPIRCKDDALVSRLAADLNHLQHIRNEAAHRGTIRRMEELSAARELALRVLVELGAVV
ncbi:MAG: hypothetical protein AMXMBFR64_51870 [Myxococcales bacterium]